MDRTWRTEKFEELPKEKQEEIAERVAKGQLESSERQLKLKERKEYLKAGRKYVVDNNVVLLNMTVRDYPITIGMQLNAKKESARVAYAICSPNDHFSTRVGRGLVGQRLQSRYVDLEIGASPLAVSDAEVRVAVLQAMVKDPQTPSRLLKKILV